MIKEQTEYAERIMSKSSMKKQVIYMASILVMASALTTGCLKFSLKKTPKQPVAEENMASEDSFDGEVPPEDYEEDTSSIEEGEVSTEAEENYFEAEYNSYDDSTNPETSVDAQGNIYHDGYVLIDKKRESLPPQAEVGYVSSVNIYAVVNPDLTVETEEVETEETKRETVPETTAPNPTEPETKAVETTAETEMETLAYPNLVGR